MQALPSRAARALTRPSTRAFSASAPPRATYRRFGGSPNARGAWADPARWGPRHKLLAGGGALAGVYYVSQCAPAPAPARRRC
jgi:hypothetical protein